MLNISRLYSYIFLLFVVFLVGSCEKDGGIIEERLVVTKEYRTISTDYSIVEFSVVNEDLVFAIGQKDAQFKLFKTTDGGINWTEINCPQPVSSWDPVFQSIAFADESNGIIVIAFKAWRTFDGGTTWTSQIVSPAGAPGPSYEFMNASVTENNEFLLVESNGNSWYDNYIFTSPANSANYATEYHFDHDGNKYDYGHYSEGKFLYLVRDFNYWDGKLLAYDLTTNDLDTLPYSGPMPFDGMYSNDRLALVTNNGGIEFYQEYSDQWHINSYGYHGEIYYSIDEIDGYFVAVANGSISTNYGGRWQEAINLDGSGHTEDFKKVQRIDQNSFYISGTNGVFLKATFK